MDDKELMSAVEKAKDNSYGSDETSQLARTRKRSIEYYLGLNTNPSPEGRSQVVDRSVYETIQVMLPSLVKIFSGSSDEVCKAMPIGPDDEKGAEQTTAVLRYFVTEKNQWEQICADWIHDAMLLCNGYCMAYWDDSEKVVRETYEEQSDEQVTALVQDKGVTVVEHSQKVDEEATQEQMQRYQQMAPQMQQMGQVQPPPQPVLLHDVVIDRKEEEGKLCIKVLPPEHCLASMDTPDWTLNECPYFEFRQQKPISELKEMGLDVPDEINDDDSYKDTEEDRARDRFGETNLDEGDRRLVWTRMIWIRAGKDNRLYYVIAVGKTLLFQEPCSRIPVSSMTTQPLPHRHIGMSVAETVTDIQDIKQAVKRGGLDNLYLANNGRNVISSRVNVEDFLDARPGGVVRMLDDSLPGEGHIVPLVHPYAFDSIIGALEYFDQDRQNRTGASRYFSGTDAGAINKTMGGTIALQNMASMRMEHVARMIAPAVESLFSAAWEIISKHANKALTIKLKGQWTLVDPQAWRTKRDIKISVGVGAGNKESMMVQLQGVLASQMQTGLPLGLVKRENIYETNVEMLKLAGFANPARFWPDPSQLPPAQPPPNPEMMKIQAEQQKTQAQLQAEAQKFQAEAELERQKLLAQAIENDKDREVELEKSRMAEATRLAIAEMNRSTTLETTNASQQFEAGKMQMEFSREDQMQQKEDQKGQEKDDGMNQLMSNLQEALNALAGAINRPRIAVRDQKTGKPLYGRPMTDEEMTSMKQ